MFFPNDSLWIISALLVLPGFWVATMCLKCLKKGRPLAAINRGVISLCLLATGSVVAGLQTGMQGYRQLSDEQTVLHIETFPLSHQRFSVLVIWPDGEEKAFYLYGDQLYIDAQILNSG